MSAVPGVTQLKSRGLMAEQRKLVSAMRRRTSMNDDEIREILGPFANRAYNAGFENGFRDGRRDGARETLAHTRRWWLVALVSVAANVMFLAHEALNYFNPG